MIVTTALLIALVADPSDLPMSPTMRNALAPLLFHSTILHTDEDHVTLDSVLFDRACIVKLEREHGAWIVTSSHCSQVKED